MTDKPKAAHGAGGIPPAEAAELEAQRRAIDRLDAEILRLFNERVSAAASIGELKRRIGLGVRDTAREAQVFRRLLELNSGGLLANRYVVRVFAALMAAAREVQSAAPRPAGRFEPPEIFAVFGNPVVHSLSPVMHNAAFAAAGVNGVYAAIRVHDIRVGVSGLRALGLRGVSITLPHKQSVMACLDYIDPEARRIQAVNTILNDGGTLKGFNTDCSGAVRALEEKTALAGKQVGVVGAGGAARAVVFGVAARGARPIVFNRSREAGEALAADAGVQFRPLSEFGGRPVDIVINTTPVGMSPEADRSPIPAERLKPGMTVMDIVYNPLKTRLLKDAEAAGCATVDGLSMFLYQGARQFELWTGLAAPVDIMRAAVEAELRAA